MNDDRTDLALDLAHWRIDSRRPPRVQAAIAARDAMLAAVAAAPPRRRRLPWPTGLRPAAPARRRALLTLTAAVAVTALTVGLGWQAPAGSRFHDLRLARERVQLALPGADDASLRLSFAEQRLADARSGSDPQASLAEASSLLADDRTALPAGRTGALWDRWRADEAELERLEGSLPPGAPPADTPTAPPGGAAGQDRGGDGASGPSPAAGGGDRGETSPTSPWPSSSARPAPTASGQPGPTVQPEPTWQPTGSPRPEPSPSSSPGADR